MFLKHVLPFVGKKVLVPYLILIWFEIIFLTSEWVILFIIILDVHLFIIHCLIPLDPWCFVFVIGSNLVEAYNLQFGFYGDPSPPHMFLIVKLSE